MLSLVHRHQTQQVCVRCSRCWLKTCSDFYGLNKELKTMCSIQNPPGWIIESQRFQDVPLHHQNMCVCVVACLFWVREICKWQNLGLGTLKMVFWTPLPGGWNHYNGSGVDQVGVEQNPPLAAVQVGAFDHVGGGVDPEHQPTFDIYCQTFWTDEICKERRKLWSYHSKYITQKKKRILHMAHSMLINKLLNSNI